MLNRYNCVDALCRAGIARTDAIALRRISMTLHRWHELECGHSNEYGAWAIVRGHKEKSGFRHDDDGAPYMERHEYRWFKDANGKQANKVSTYHTLLADRERGALKHLAAIMARYPDYQAYVQGYPRGCALYILRPGDVREGADVSSCYSNGVAVCQ